VGAGYRQPVCELLQTVVKPIAEVEAPAGHWAISNANRPSRMTTMNTAIAIEPTLACKVEELQALLNDPRPDDCDWSERLITALEQVADYALETNVPVRALSRSLRASVSLPRRD